MPPPSAGQVQIRVEAAGLNFRDVLNVLGLYPGDPGRIGGGDLSGIVTELGAGVTGFEVGQRVFGFMPGRSPPGSTCPPSSWRRCRTGSAR